MPDVDDVDAIAGECDNRQRWKDDPGRGTLHYITAEVAARAAAGVRSGEVVSLARPVHPIPLTGGPHAAAVSAVPAPVGHALLYTGFPPLAMTDLLTINTHHATLTHLDALGHITTDNTVYPGVPLTEAVRDGRLAVSDVTALGPAIFTSGVLLDFASGAPLAEGHPITGEDLDQLARRQGSTVESGDALVIRANPATRAGIPPRPSAGCTTTRSASTSATSPTCSHHHETVPSRCRCTRSDSPGWACPSSTAQTPIPSQPRVPAMTATPSPSPWDRYPFTVPPEAPSRHSHSSDQGHLHAAVSCTGPTTRSSLATAGRPALWGPGQRRLLRRPQRHHGLGGGHGAAEPASPNAASALIHRG